MISIWIPGKPVAKGRARAFKTKGGHIGHYTPEKTRTWEGIARTLAMEAMAVAGIFKPLEGPLRMEVMICVPIPASWPQWKREMALSEKVWPTVKPDSDNVLKAVKDSLNGVVWVDDAQVCVTEVGKVYSEIPGVEVGVCRLVGQAAQTAKKVAA